MKHATFVDGVWFDQAVTGRSYAEIGIASTVDGAFTLHTSDTIASVQNVYRDRWDLSRRTLADLRSDDVVTGRGPRPAWALQLQVLRELAHHAGHADILREQILASRSLDDTSNHPSRSVADPVGEDLLRWSSGASMTSRRCRHEPASTGRSPGPRGSGS